MQFLTVVTTVFMPLTLITGWYGMNFHSMPELNAPWAYPAVILVSLAILLAEVLFFRRKSGSRYTILLPKELTAPNQHRPLWDLRWEPDDIGLFPLPGALSHIHSKTACRGASERQWRSVANRPSRQARLSPSAHATKPAKTLGFRGFLFSCVTWFCGSLWFGHWVFSSGFTRSQLFPSPPAPKTHPVSPFSGFSGCVFAFFCCFAGAKFTGLFLCILPHSAHRLKPSVIPCKREVSFLT